MSTPSTATYAEAPSEGRPLPLVIQGGMGVAVSSWRLASAVARAGQLGVVSGTALDTVLARQLQDGDPGGEPRRALAAFPAPAVAERALARYFRPGGRPPGAPYTPVPRLALRQSPRAQELAILANFVEVWLAKEGHRGPVGVNYLEKVQMATPAAAYGAMLAGVDYVLVGAGYPTRAPAAAGPAGRSPAGAAAGRGRGCRRRQPRCRPGPAGPARRRPAVAGAPDVPGHRLGARARGLPSWT